MESSPLGLSPERSLYPTDTPCMNPGHEVPLASATHVQVGVGPRHNLKKHKDVVRVMLPKYGLLAFA